MESKPIEGVKPTRFYKYTGIPRPPSSIQRESRKILLESLKTTPPSSHGLYYQPIGSPFPEEALATFFRAEVAKPAGGKEEIYRPQTRALIPSPGTPRATSKDKTKKKNIQVQPTRVTMMGVRPQRETNPAVKQPKNFASQTIGMSMPMVHRQPASDAPVFTNRVPPTQMPCKDDQCCQPRKIGNPPTALGRATTRQDSRHHTETTDGTSLTILENGKRSPVQDVTTDNNENGVTKRERKRGALSRKDCYTLVAIYMLVPLIVVVVLAYNSIDSLLEEEDDVKQEEHNRSQDKQMIVWKIVFAIVLALWNFVCWWIPLHSTALGDNRRALSLANAFAGGVFLALAFGHLIPESLHIFHEESDSDHESLPLLLVLVGYLVIFFVEKVAFGAHDILHAMEAHGDEPGQSCHHGHGQYSHTISYPQNGDQDTNNGTGLPTASVSGRTAIILLAALGLHSITESMALGLTDNFGDLALLSVSIAIHQPAESLALVVPFIKSGMPRRDIRNYLTMFSTIGPIGFALGVLVNAFAPPMVDSLMVAVVAGTFVYVGATEVIPEEWESSEFKWAKFASLMVGIVVILAITELAHRVGGNH